MDPFLTYVADEFDGLSIDELMKVRVWVGKRIMEAYNCETKEEAERKFRSDGHENDEIVGVD